MASFRKTLASIGAFINPVNTLNGHPKPTEAPPAKRPRKDSSEYTTSGFAPPLEDSTFDPAPRASVQGSQGSATLMSNAGGPRAKEYLSMEENLKKLRTNRRGSRPRGESSLYARRHASIEHGRDEIIDNSGDELAILEPVRPPIRSRPASTQLLPADGADSQFYPRAKKARKHPIEIEDDELGEGPHSRQPPRPLANHNKGNPPSVSERGDIASTQWATARGDPIGVGFRVKAAVCLPKHRFLENSSSKEAGSKDGGGEVWLRKCHSQGHEELRAFHTDGSEVEEDPWLRITKKANTLYYDLESELVKIDQSTEDHSQIGQIGRMLMLKFQNKADATEVARWAERNLKSCSVKKETSAKLSSIWEKTLVDVNQKLTSKMPAPPSARLFDDLDRQKEVIYQERSLAQRNGLANPDYHSAFDVPKRHPDMINKSRSPAQQNGFANATSHRPVDDPDTARTQVKDRMKTSTADRQAQHPQSYTAALLLPRETRGNTRSALQGSGVEARLHGDPPSPPAETPRWSESNTEWARDWKIPLVFHRTTVNKDDIPRLDEGQCLNDNLIGFGLRYLFDSFDSRHPELSKRVYMHNSYFYEKLKSGRGGRHINYDGVKTWTSKVDLFSYDYIVVPVNEHFHWWVAIICNPSRLDPEAPKRSPVTISHHADEETPDTTQKTSSNDAVPPDLEMPDIEISRLSIDCPPENGSSNLAGKNGDGVEGIVDLAAEDRTVAGNVAPSARKAPKRGKKTLAPRQYDPEDFRIITLDSLGSAHSPAVQSLKQYLVEEMRDKKNKKLEEVPNAVGTKASHIPEQDNFCDCGVYLLGYIQEFVKDPDRFVRTLLKRDHPEWDIDGRKSRIDWRDRILSEQKTYQTAQEEYRRKKQEECMREKHGNNAPTDHTDAQSASVQTTTDTQKQMARSGAQNVSAVRSPGTKSPGSEKNGLAAGAISPSAGIIQDHLAGLSSKLTAHASSLETGKDEPPLSSTSPKETESASRQSAAATKEGSSDEMVLILQADNIDHEVRHTVESSLGKGSSSRSSPSHSSSWQQPETSALRRKPAGSPVLGENPYHRIVEQVKSKTPDTEERTKTLSRSPPKERLPVVRRGGIQELYDLTGSAPTTTPRDDQDAVEVVSSNKVCHSGGSGSGNTAGKMPISDAAAGEPSHLRPTPTPTQKKRVASSSPLGGSPPSRRQRYQVSGLTSNQPQLQPPTNKGISSPYFYGHSAGRRQPARKDHHGSKYLKKKAAAVMAKDGDSVPIDLTTEDSSQLLIEEDHHPDPHAESSVI
ncbi:hypothetical protein B0H66DRAFT_599727 [Apodospora peruviana]|uniref:Ubiquitin-like protease family profile domain-containing protein n=1 Tax=Apodospora peruviana TaxID=516989 RepID=A0AAE0IIH4_9PEZI|nr:hypothetical protein B0H66DRAFT_599727 [Apodospora peruviana]